MKDGWQIEDRVIASNSIYLGCGKHMVFFPFLGLDSCFYFPLARVKLNGAYTVVVEGYSGR